MVTKGKSGTPDGMVDLFKKATTEMVVLNSLKSTPKYVYQMLKELNNISDTAFQLTTLQPTVRRLLQNRYIKEINIPQTNKRERKYYLITDTGKIYLEQLIIEFENLTAGIKKILSYGENNDEKKD